MTKNGEIKTVVVLLSFCIVFAVTSGVYWIFVLQRAHSTFQDYYNFRGCVELLEQTPDYGTCKTDKGEVIKITKVQNKWYLEGDGPGVW